MARVICGMNAFSSLAGMMTTTMMVVVMMMTTMMVMVSGQHVQWSDEDAGTHLNTVSPRGIGMSVKWWDHRLKPKVDAVDDVLTQAEDKVVEYEAGALPNITAYIEGHLDAMITRLEEAEALAESKGFNNTDDELFAYGKSPVGSVNNGNHYSTTSSMFTVPKDGLYKVLARSFPWDSSFSGTVSRNGAETLCSVSHAHYYDLRTCIRIVQLDAGDEIYTTGDTFKIFQVMNIRLQTLMPDFLNA